MANHLKEARESLFKIGRKGMNYVIFVRVLKLNNNYNLL